MPNIITPPNFRNRLTICDIIGDYYTSSEGKILFNCPTDETVYDCLSRRIDHFELILNNKVSISSIVNKAREKDCELDSNQTILMLHRMQYLRFSYRISEIFPHPNTNIQHGHTNQSEFLEENCDSGDESLSQEDFLKLFKMKNVSNTTMDPN